MAFALIIIHIHSASSPHLKGGAGKNLKREGAHTKGGISFKRGAGKVKVNFHNYGVMGISRHSRDAKFKISWWNHGQSLG